MAPVATRLKRAEEVYRAIRNDGPQIKKLSADGRVMAIAADPLFCCITAEFCGFTAEPLVDRQAAIKAAADFANVTVEQLEQHLKRGRRRAKR